MKIASEFSNSHYSGNLPQGIKPAYALESEQGKEELLDEYQEKLEEKQKTTPEDEEPPKSLTDHHPDQPPPDLAN